MNMNEDPTMSNCNCLTFPFNYTNLPGKCTGDAPVNLEDASQGRTGCSEDNLCLGYWTAVGWSASPIWGKNDIYASDSKLSKKLKYIIKIYVGQVVLE